MQFISDYLSPPTAACQRAHSIGIAVAFLLAVTGCSASDTSEAYDAAEPAAPKAAADALSLGGNLDQESLQSLDGATACAVALRVTREKLMNLSGAGGSAEMRALEQAEKVFRDRAVNSGSVDRDVVDARIVSESRSDEIDTAEMAQFAIGCLNSLQS